ncbi:hypothetical protein POMI540_0897 [Schizosaccharomyces pombe]
MTTTPLGKMIQDGDFVFQKAKKGTTIPKARKKTLTKDLQVQVAKELEQESSSTFRFAYVFPRKAQNHYYSPSRIHTSSIKKKRPKLCSNINLTPWSLIDSTSNKSIREQSREMGIISIQKWAEQARMRSLCFPKN